MRSRTPGRFAVRDEIRRLDPERDHQRILHLSFGYDFPWDSVRALEIALYRTYASAGVSGLLERTGEFFRHPQRRYDDTAILIAEMCKHGYASGRGRQALKRMNWAHAHFRIANEDFLFVLSTFILEPIRWIDSFAWRELVPNERLGYYWFWREIGTRMGIRDIPPTLDEFREWARRYESERFRPADSNRRIATATRELFVSWFPRPLASLVRSGIHAVLDDSVLHAFGFPRPARPVRGLVRGTLRMRGRMVRWLPPRREPHFFMDDPNRTYPGGYAIDAMGPPHLVAREAASRRDGPREPGDRE